MIVTLLLVCRLVPAAVVPGGPVQRLGHDLLEPRPGAHSWLQRLSHFRVVKHSCVGLQPARHTAAAGANVSHLLWDMQALTRILIGLTEADSGADLPAGVAGHYLNNKALAMFVFVQFVLVTWTYGSAIVSGAIPSGSLRCVSSHSVPSYRTLNQVLPAAWWLTCCAGLWSIHTFYHHRGSLRPAHRAPGAPQSCCPSVGS